MTNPASRQINALIEGHYGTLSNMARVYGLHRNTLNGWRRGATPKDATAVARIERECEALRTGRYQELGQVPCSCCPH